METIKELLIEQCDEMFNEEDYEEYLGVTPHKIFKSMKLTDKDVTKDQIMEHLHNTICQTLGCHTDDLENAFRIYSDCKYIINNVLSK